MRRFSHLVLFFSTAKDLVSDHLGELPPDLTIRLFACDFYRVIVDEDECFSINLLDVQNLTTTPYSSQTLRKREEAATIKLLLLTLLTFHNRIDSE